MSVIAPAQYFSVMLCAIGVSYVIGTFSVVVLAVVVVGLVVGLVVVASSGVPSSTSNQLNLNPLSVSPSLSLWKCTVTELVALRLTIGMLLHPQHFSRRMSPVLVSVMLTQSWGQLFGPDLWVQFPSRQKSSKITRILLFVVLAERTLFHFTELS